MLKRILSVAVKLLITLTLIAFLVALFCILSFIIYATTDKALNVSELASLAKAQDRTTKLYYIESENNGNITATELESEALYASQNREWVKYENIPTNLINAFVAVEDHRFFDHNGIDTKRTAGAILGFITGKSSYGGSTINQQLIKNVSGDNDYSVSRKVREMIKAAKLDKELSKNEILELYLNTIYLSENSYGIGTAAESYFGKEVSELNLTECAALACIPQSPTKWDPIRNPQNNEKRRQTVLYRMYELGFINESDLKNAIETELKTVDDRTRKSENENIYSWYTESVIDECIELLLSKGVAKNEQTAKKLLYTGGLSVITAQNPKIQSKIDEYFANERNFYPQGSLIHPECSMV
ncbi:MAG: transglycosylase domain-containing protein, partial [Clostridia bacterium]|nr:transglycosylase domain-containing protein [Clostridia bacterium]